MKVKVVNTGRSMVGFLQERFRLYNCSIPVSDTEECVKRTLMALNRYLQGPFLKFLSREGLDKDIEIKVMWGAEPFPARFGGGASSSGMAMVNQNQIMYAVKNNKPFEVRVFYERPLLNNVDRRIAAMRDNPKEALIDIDRLLTEILVHESTHLAQGIYKSEMFQVIIESRAAKSLEDFEINLLKDYLLKIMNIVSLNERILALAKTEGEATYFSLQYSLYSATGGDFKLRRQLTDQEFDRCVNVAKPVINEYVIYLKKMLGLIKENKKLAEDIIRLSLRDYELERELDHKDVESTTNELRQIISKFAANERDITLDMTIEGRAHYELGYIMMHVLSKCKQYRTNLTRKTIMKKAIEAKINPLRRELKFLYKYVTEINEQLVEFEKIIPTENRELLHIADKIDSILK